VDSQHIDCMRISLVVACWKEETNPSSNYKSVIDPSSCYQPFPTLTFNDEGAVAVRMVPRVAERHQRTS
jgi:hypothetical protein